MSAGTSTVDGNLLTAANSSDSTDGPSPMKFFSKKLSTAEKMSIDKDAPFYPMNRKKRGVCLILDYHKFVIPNVEDRVGSAATCEYLEKTFSELGFDVKVKPNLTKTKTMSKISSIAGRYRTDYDCFVMFVLTRGLEDGTLYATDDWFRQEDLYAPFTADLCKSLAGRPKLFFLQVSLNSANSREIKYRRDTSELREYKYPVNSDFLTTYGFASDDGPCFVQLLAEELRENGSVGDVLSNLTAVSRKIGNAFVPYSAFTLTKRVVFKNDVQQLPEYSGGDDYYNMNHKRRGICLIVSNSVFTMPGVLDRSKEGCDRDLENVEATFIQLGFEVLRIEERTKSEIMTEVGRVAEDSDFSEDDCFAMVIMSHGDENGVIYAKDDLYYLKTIFNMFTDDKRPKLAQKPRLFFIQACKGRKLDSGITLHQLDNIPAIREILIQPDFLVAYSTVPGYYSFRDTVEGSWFIQILVRELDRNKKLHDLLTILTFVNRGVAIEFESRTRNPFDDWNKRKIVPYVTTRLTKLVKFL